MTKFFRRVCFLLLILLLNADSSPAVTRYEFLTGLLNARGINWSSSPEAPYSDSGGFMLRTGYVTDNVKDLDGQVTRREALRWCIESLGLAFEAGILADYPTGFNDVAKLQAFDKGCLVVALNMNPDERFRPYEGLTQKEANAIYERVRSASVGLTLNMIRNPLKGMRIYIHRDGVPTGIPAWRFYAYGIKTRTAAEYFRDSLRDDGVSVSITSSGGSFGVRTDKTDDYNDIRELITIAEARGLSYKILPSITNPNTRILPRYWIMLTIDPALFRVRPMTSANGAREFASLSRMSSGNWASAAINGGFFSVTRAGQGYPIGALRIDGRNFSEPYDNRGTLAWNDDYSVFKLSTEDFYEFDGMNNIIQGGPLMIVNGQAVWYDEGFNSALISTRHPRSAVGVNSSGHWVFFVVDGRNGMHSSGATISELTEIMRGQGIIHALNLDGGGSTEIIINGKIYNSPSDGYERMISYGLGAFPAE